MIREEDIEKGFDWLRENEAAAARARGERVYAEEYRKSLRAILMSQSDEKTIAAKEVEAYSHPKYLEHLETLRDAVVADETFRARIGRVHMLIDMFRTQESSRRAMGKV